LIGIHLWSEDKPYVFICIYIYENWEQKVITESLIKQLIQNRFPKKFKNSKQQREECIKNLVLSCKNNADFNNLEFLRGIAYDLSF